MYISVTHVTELKIKYNYCDYSQVLVTFLSTYFQHSRTESRLI